MQDKPFQVKLPIWEGPLDLLLELIRSAKMDIFDIPIHEITKQYLGAIEDMKQLNLKVDTGFLSMAAQLLAIKAKMLLPVPLEANEDNDWDPRRDLVRQLLLYERYRQASKKLALLLEVEVVPVRNPQDQHGFASRAKSEINWKVLDTETLATTLSRLLNNLHLKPFLQRNIDEPYHIEDKLRLVENAFQSQDQMPFDDLYDQQALNRQEVVVSFWAVLELYKRRFLDLLQQRRFGEMTLLRRPKP